MTALLYLAGVLVFAVGLAISIGLHEAAHMAFGKLFGVRVPQYFVGFGRTIWSTRRGETEYGVKAFPFGGYVKLIGMLPPGKGDAQKHRSGSTGMFSQLVSDARAQENEQIQPGDEDRVFYRLAWWRKVIVMAAGATTNVVLAFLLFAGVFMIHGVSGQPSTTIDHVSQCVKAIPADQTHVPACRPGDPVTPARKAGLRAGDRILAFNGTEIHSYDQFQRLVRANGSGSATLVVDRDGSRRVLHTSTTINSLPALKGDGEVKAGFLGLTPTVHTVRKGPGYTVEAMGRYTWDTLKALGSFPQKLWGVGKAILGEQPRAADSPMSVVGAGRVAGEIASNRQDSVGDRVAFVFLLLAGVNLFVGMFNFVPLLPLDGGHIAGALYEAVRRGLARLLRRPDPGYFDVAKLLPVAYAMAAVLLVVTVLLVYADLVVPV